MGGIRELLRDQRGVSAIEYGLLGALIALGMITSLQEVGGQLLTSYEHVGDELSPSAAAGGNGNGNGNAGGNGNGNAGGNGNGNAGGNGNGNAGGNGNGNAGGNGNGNGNGP